MKGEEDQTKKATEKVAQEMGDKISGKYQDFAQKLTQKGGMVPKDALGLSDSFVEGIYGQAYRLYNSGRYKDASQLFRLLLMMDATEAKYVLGLAACFHMQKEYKAAVDTYSMCGILDANSPVPHFHASDCYIKMGDLTSALICLDLAVKRAGDKPEFATLKDRAQMTIESVKKEMQVSDKGKKKGEKDE